MPFVNEVISEEEKNNFDFSIIELPYQSRPNLYKWTIDRERDSFLLWVKQDREPPYPNIYAFVWKGLRFEPWVCYTSEKAASGKLIQTCRIENVYLPKNFPLPSRDNDEMLAMLQEALLIETKARYQKIDNTEEIRIENPFKKGAQQ